MLVESNKKKAERLSTKRQAVLKEKKDVREKLRSIEQQQEALIAAYKERHKQAREALKRPPPQIFGLSKPAKTTVSSATATMSASMNQNSGRGPDDF